MAEGRGREVLWPFVCLPYGSPDCLQNTGLLKCIFCPQKAAGPRLNKRDVVVHAPGGHQLSSVELGEGGAPGWDVGVTPCP